MSAHAILTALVDEVGSGPISHLVGLDDTFQVEDSLVLALMARQRSVLLASGTCHAIALCPADRRVLMHVRFRGGVQVQL